MSPQAAYLVNYLGRIRTCLPSLENLNSEPSQLILFFLLVSSGSSVNISE